MLSPEQLARRRESIGASEIAAVLGLSPYKSTWDLWREKTGTAETTPDTAANDAGDFLEPGLRQLYRYRTGLEMSVVGTLHHPTMPFLSATPDGVLPDRSRGLEIKVIGPRMLSHWSGGPPEYVEAQARQGMLVTNASAWDVLMCCGTEIVIHTFERDLELEAWIIREASAFWSLVETRTPPDALAAAERMAAAKLKWPAKKSDEYIVDESAGAIALEYERLDAEAKRIKACIDHIKADLAERCQDAAGLRGSWGSFAFYEQAGSPRYKAIAEELAGGTVPAELLKKHRGEPDRRARVTPKKKRTA